MAANHLFRGINAELYVALNGELRPKQRTIFAREPEFGRDEWGNCYWGNTPLNSVIEHQRDQAGHPTSGVSTTPHIEVARKYATYGNKAGYIYVIDRDKCTSYGVMLYVVNDCVPQPYIQDDDEVVLVAQDFGTLPSEIIVEIIEA